VLRAFVVVGGPICELFRERTTVRRLAPSLRVRRQASLRCVPAFLVVVFAARCVLASDVWAYSAERVTNATGQTVAHIVTEGRRAAVRNACGGNIGHVDESGT